MLKSLIYIGEGNSKWTFFHQNIPEILLFLYWLLTQIVLGLILGVRQPVDSPVYLDAANDLISLGKLPDSHDIYYLGYCLFIASIFKIGGGVMTVVLLQIILSGLALASLYFSTLSLSKNKATALVAGFLFVFWFKIHQWNFYIYTESLFTSLLLISFFVIVKTKNGLHLLLGLPLFILTFLVRPTGFGFILALVIFGIIRLFQHNRALAILFSSISIIFCVLLLNKMLSVFDFIESYKIGEVIYPRITLFISMPSRLILPESSIPVVRLVEFILSNPWYFFKLSMIKLFVFFANVKPYFSLAHNLYIVLVLYPMYFFAIKGFFLFKTDIAIKYFVLTLILSQGLTVMLTSENWDGRFLIPVLPFVFILAGIGIGRTKRITSIVKFCPRKNDKSRDYKIWKS